jgi:hypothetical protein
MPELALEEADGLTISMQALCYGHQTSHCPRTLSGQVQKMLQ